MKPDDTSDIIPSLVLQHIEIFVCPVCNAGLDFSADRQEMRCTGCDLTFGCERGIPLLFWPKEQTAKKDVTQDVKAFYEETPFPNYEEFDSPWSLREKAQKGVFSRLLDEQIPHGAKILEVGCGTGQLGNFLGLSQGRTVFSADICLNSLKLGQEFKQKCGIDNTAFVQMNLFRPVFKPEFFDVVICTGVLHHTSDPFLGFRSILKLLRPGGCIIIGLYNTYGRIPTDVRRLIFNLSGNRFRFLDPRLRDSCVGETRKRTWFMDQYKHPHESKHSIGEALGWFDQCGVQFINSIPKPTALGGFSQDEKLFRANPRGTTLDHFLVQLNMLLSGGKEGGFFIMIGRNQGTG